MEQILQYGTLALFCRARCRDSGGIALYQAVRGPLLISMLLTLLFGFMHWMPYKEARRTGGARVDAPGLQPALPVAGDPGLVLFLRGGAGWESAPRCLDYNRCATPMSVISTFIPPCHSMPQPRTRGRARPMPTGLRVARRLLSSPVTSRGKALRELRLARPLDFAAVTDHAELLGEVSLCQTPGSATYDSWQCLVYRHAPRVAYYLFNYTAARRGGSATAARMAVSAARRRLVRGRKSSKRQQQLMIAVQTAVSPVSWAMNGPAPRGRRWAICTVT
ncbi:MAG: DUF3604 domain-containing protein [Gammaproteobacteria bacterium]|nr:DUF3604 domain-containing protein [Gammaproteobacteria bacterium]